VHTTAESIQTRHAAEAIGPYSQAVRSGPLLFVSGQLPLDPSTGQVISDDVRVQSHRVLKSLTGILEAAGGSLEHVVRTTVFLNDLRDFSAVNEVYATYFTAPFPARSTVQVAALPKGVCIEIDAIAVLPER
jgi:2-iminobutanoate/2-iminopropanoate deaminase